MEHKIDQLIADFPKLSFLKSAWFDGLSAEKQEFVLELIEDARFWLDMDKGKGDDGFKFLAATFGMNRAQDEANEQDMAGKKREEYLRPHQDLLTQFNPYSGRTND